MEIVEFQGVRCMEKPVADWQQFTCKHLKSVVTCPDDERPTSVNRVLQDGSRTSEIFLIINGPLPKFEQRDSSPLIQKNDHITCGQCWINVYASSNL